jgi:hypothetical protein
VAEVHCRYHRIGFHPDDPDEPDLPDGYVWLCLGEIGAVDSPGDRLVHYHDAVPLLPCSCGYDPCRTEAPVNPREVTLEPDEDDEGQDSPGTSPEYVYDEETGEYIEVDCEGRPYDD